MKTFNILYGALVAGIMLVSSTASFAMGEYGPSEGQVMDYLAGMHADSNAEIVKTYARPVANGHAGFITQVKTDACEGSVFLTSSTRGVIYGSYASGSCDDTLAEYLGSHSFEMLADKLFGKSESNVAATE